MIKRIVSLLTAALLICGIVFGVAASVVFAESLYVRKIVSVVYDDSASMGGQDWAYANYAMQTFCGMMNSEDQLFITYMSGVLYNPLYKPYSAICPPEAFRAPWIPSAATKTAVQPLMMPLKQR